MAAFSMSLITWFISKRLDPSWSVLSTLRLPL